MPIIGNVDVCLEEQHIEWTIYNFLSLPETTKYYSSSKFTFDNKLWYFDIYPNGDTGRNAKGFISVYLMRHTSCHKTKVEFSFSVKTTDQKNYRKNTYVRVFTNRINGFGDPTFLSRSELLKRQLEIMPCDDLTILCNLKFPIFAKNTTESLTCKYLSDVEPTKCSQCKEILDEEDISDHEKKCINRPIKCPECFEVVVLKNWYEHECQVEDRRGDFKTAECAYCKDSLDDENISDHEKKCINRPIKCPNCSEIVVLKNWYEHECQMAETRECSFCQKTLKAETIVQHEKKCMNKLIKCPECCDVIVLLDWYDHECQSSGTKDGTTVTNCSYCKEKLDAKTISVHEKKCMNKPVKCPDCSTVIILKNWYEHDCQVAGAKDDRILSEDFKKVLLDGKNHDLILKIGDKELRAHQDILMARSPVFESMFNHDMKEKKSGVIDVPDCDPQAMELFLTYVYCGKVETLDQSNMFGLYYIADKYDMKGLKEECCDFIKKSLSTTIVCEAVQLALKHSDTDLLEYATEYFKNNVLDIMRTIEWQSFLKDNSVVGNELLIKSFEKLKT